MTGLTRWVLRHKLLVAGFWLVVAVAGAMNAATATHRMVNSFSLPGAGIATDNKIVSIYHDGGQDPLIPVVTAPAGQSIASRVNASRECRSSMQRGSPRLCGWWTIRRPVTASS